MSENAKDRTSLESAFIVVSWTCGFILLLVIGSCVVGIATSHSDQQVSGEITVTSEWAVISSKEPLKPQKQHQHLNLEVAEPLLRDNTNLENIRLANGTPVHLEAQIVDEYGNVYDLNMQRTPTPSRHENSIYDYSSRLPKDRTYTQVRLRSDKPLRLSRVLWHCYNHTK